jgi:hypothetical protein
LKKIASSDIEKDMKMQRIFGGALLVLGAALFLYGNYVSKEVEEGRQKIEIAQDKLDHGPHIPHLRPVPRHMEEMERESAQSRIDQKKEMIDNYEMLATWLHGGGIVVFIGGALLLAFTFNDRKKPLK